MFQALYITSMKEAILSGGSGTKDSDGIAALIGKFYLYVYNI